MPPCPTILALDDHQLVGELLALESRFRNSLTDDDDRLLDAIAAAHRQSSGQRYSMTPDTRRKAETLLAKLRGLDPSTKLVAALDRLVRVASISHVAIQGKAAGSESVEFGPVAAPATTRNLNPALLNTDIDLNNVIFGLAKQLNTSPRLVTRADGRKAVLIDRPLTDLADLDEDALATLADMRLLLYGAPGTGKTEFARDACARLGIPLRCVDYGSVTGRYVGDTERNITKLFTDAKERRYAILLDECDTLLTSRGLADKSWERTQVSQMLTMLDAHTMPVWLTTNYIDLLDEALVRRVPIFIQFKPLDPDQIAIAFRSFFGFDGPSSIRKLECLTPGAFTAVKRRATLLGEFGRDQLVQALVRIDELNRGKSARVSTEPIGFVGPQRVG